MRKEARRFALMVAAAATVAMVLFPPFSVSTMTGGGVEYGFLLSGPPSVRQAVEAAAAIGGREGQDMARDMVQFSLDAARLLLQLGLLWTLLLAALKTVLKPASRDATGPAAE
jgi:hypothetical protein